MSANYITDLNSDAVFAPSLISGNGVSGQVCGLSGMYVGQSIDLLNANSFCNVWVVGNPALASGDLRIQVQTSDTDTSGLYTDPTSGLAQLPTVFSSGGILWINASGTGGIYNSGTYSGFCFYSGFSAFGAFQRPQRYARLVFLSGFYIGSLLAGFVSQIKTTGSGGGFSWQPSSGQKVNV